MPSRPKYAKRLYLRADVPMRDRIFYYISVDVETRCWNWLGGLTNGYGKITWPGRDCHVAHRASYETFVGPIPEGLQLDHLCRNRRCVNPDHLEPVTQRENLLRSPIAPPGVNAAKTHCKRGHEFTARNTRIDKSGARSCGTCRNALKKKRYYERKAAA